MNDKKNIRQRKSDITSIAIISAAAIIAVIILIVWSGNRKENTVESLPETSETDSIVVIKEVDKLVEVEKTITATIMQDGLNDMGFLVTQEYWFTEAIEYSSVKSLFGLELSFTESGYLLTYEGTIYAGVDFSSVTVKKDDDAKYIRITVPKATIQSTDIDFDSFKLYSEKSGFANPLSVNDYNNSLSALKNTAAEKALGRGILDKAYENACTLIKNFVGGMTDISGYEFEFVCAE